MHSLLAQPWYDDFVLPAQISAAELQHRARRGEIRRVRRGVWIRSERAEGLDERSRHRVRMRAAVLARSRDLVFSHESAAAAWGVPMLRSFAERVHAVSDRAGGGRSDDDLIRHCVDVPADIVRIDGLLVTSLARTIVDLGRTLDFAAAVVAADAALAGRCAGVVATRSELLDQLGPRGRRGVARALEVIAFADASSGSPGESVSRCSISAAGLPMPELQSRFADRFGAMYVDFWWPRHRVVGEFDGVAKYIREEYTRGRSAAEIVVEEKRREDRLRAQDVRVVRWGMREAVSPRALGSLLAAAGIRPDVERYRSMRARPKRG